MKKGFKRIISLGIILTMCFSLFGCGKVLVNEDNIPVVQGNYDISNFLCGNEVDFSKSDPLEGLKCEDIEYAGYTLDGEIFKNANGTQFYYCIYKKDHEDTNLQTIETAIIDQLKDDYGKSYIYNCRDRNSGYELHFDNGMYIKVNITAEAVLPCVNIFVVHDTNFSTHMEDKSRVSTVNVG